MIKARKIGKGKNRLKKERERERERERDRGRGKSQINTSMKKSNDRFKHLSLVKVKRMCKIL